MKYDCMVKYNGQYYKAGEDVPVKETVEASSSEEEVKNPGRPRKAAGQ